MKITSVDVVLVDQPAVEPAFRWRTGLPGSEPARTEGWLILRTDEGITGYGHHRRGVILEDVVNRRLRSELLGADPFAREYLWHRLWEVDRIEEFPIYLHGVVDTALWDIGGKAAGLPVHQLLGTFRREIPAYASTVTLDSVEEYLDVADQALALGYPAIKLHAWGDPARDSALALALRAHVGDGVPLMFDGSAGYDLLDAIRVGRALAEADYLFYEEPMREFSITAYQRLAERVDVPLLVAETSDGAHMSTADFIASGCAVGVRTSADLRGGITGAMRIAHLADSYLMRAEVHGGGLPNTHLCMAIRNNTYYESLLLANPVQRDACVDERGLVHAPTGPGIGYEQVWDVTGRPAGV
jgi:L-alanine-DL-glutamate epimerase-like enolase superfamily enzyme